MGRTALHTIAGRCGAALIAIGAHGLAAAQPDSEPIHQIVESVLDASSLGDTERRAVELRFDELERAVALRAGNVRSPERRARRLHRFLHDRVFLHYQEDADGIADVVARGNFNCVSSTLVEGLLAKSLGLEPSIVADSRHILLRLTLPSHAVDVETTIPNGFDVRGNAAASARFLLAGGLAEADAIPLRGARDRFDEEGSQRSVVKLEDGAAFVWYNAAERALSRGEGRGAAERLLAGQTRYPGVATGGGSLQTLLGHAFRVDYDAARFDDAYRTAAIGVLLGPSVVSAHDRLVAVAAQRVERLVDSGDVGEAEAVVVDVQGMLGGGSSRFERHVLPLIVAAAVRVGDWERADCLSDRFTAVELDAVEARRLRAWVRGRRNEADSAR